MIYHLTFVEFCLTLMISNQFDIMKSYKFTLIRWSNHFHYSGGSTCDGSSGLFCLLTWKVGGIGIVPVGSYKAFTELPLLGLAPSTSTKWCDVAEFQSYLLSNTILLHKNNSSPLQNRKRDSLFLSSRAELPFREGISIQKQAFLGCQAVLCWCCRLENAGYMLPSTSNRLINMKSTSGMLCGRMFTATSVWRKCLWRCVFLSVLHNSFAKKRARTYCAKWQKIPHAHSHLRKAWLQYVIKLQVSNSIKNRIAGSMVDGNITVPNGAWVRSYDKLNAWELRHLWCGKTAQRKLCEAWDGAACYEKLVDWAFSNKIIILQYAIIGPKGYMFLWCLARLIKWPNAEWQKLQKWMPTTKCEEKKHWTYNTILAEFHGYPKNHSW